MLNRFTIHKRVEFAETDLAGVMHFANYLRWMEEVEHAYFRSLGMSVVQEMDGATVSWPRVSVGCDYAGSLRFEDEVQVAIGVAAVGEKSITFEVTFACRGNTVARGTMKAVCCTMKDGQFKSIRIPELFREKFQASP